MSIVAAALVTSATAWNYFDHGTLPDHSTSPAFADHYHDSYYYQDHGSLDNDNHSHSNGSHSYSNSSSSYSYGYGSWTWWKTTEGSCNY